jgi:hypothetical protein
MDLANGTFKQYLTAQADKVFVLDDQQELK